MNKMRKWMTMAMAGTLAVTSLGTSMVFAEDGSDKIDMTMMVWGNVDDYIPSNEVLMEKFPELAEKINLNVELGGSGDSDVAEKLRLMLASGEELPDLIRLNYTQFPEFAEAGVLYDLSDAIAPYEDDIIDAAKTLMTYDGSYYAVPQEVKPKVWLYRKDIFDDCGVNPDEIKTVDDFLEAAATIHEKYPDSYIENYGTPLNNYDLTGKIPPLVSASEDEYYLNSEYFGDMSKYFEAMENFSVYPYNPSSSQELPIVAQYLTEYLNGTMELDAALEAADADLMNQIGNPYE